MNKYKVSGRFSVYNRLGDLIDGHLFLNKVFESESLREARNKGLIHIKQRVRKKYGKDAMFKQTKKVLVLQYHKSIPKKKNKRNKGRQLSLF